MCCVLSCIIREFSDEERTIKEESKRCKSKFISALFCNSYSFAPRQYSSHRLTQLILCADKIIKIIKIVNFAWRSHETYNSILFQTIKCHGREAMKKPKQKKLKQIFTWCDYSIAHTITEHQQCNVRMVIKTKKIVQSCMFSVSLLLIQDYKRHSLNCNSIRMRVIN